MSKLIADNGNNTSSDYTLVQRCLNNNLKKNIYLAYNPVCQKCKERNVVRPATNTKVVRNNVNFFDNYISLCDSCFSDEN